MVVGAGAFVVGDVGAGGATAPTVGALDAAGVGDTAWFTLAVDRDVLRTPACRHGGLAGRCGCAGNDLPHVLVDHDRLRGRVRLRPRAGPAPSGIVEGDTGVVVSRSFSAVLTRRSVPTITTSEISVRATTADTSKAFGRLMWRPSAVSYDSHRQIGPTTLRMPVR